jgi:acyl-CoA oxidase
VVLDTETPKNQKKMAQESSINTASRRTRMLNNHLVQSPSKPTSCLQSNSCLSYSPPELTESFDFDIKEMRKILDFHNLEDRDWLFGVIKQGRVFNGKERGGRLFVSPDYNQTMEQQREMTMKRIEYLLERGAFDGWLTKKGVEAELKKLALLEVIEIFDHSLAIKTGVHFFLWYCIDFCFGLMGCY